MSMGPYPGAQQPLPPAKKSNLLVIILVVVIGLFVLVGAVVLAGGYFIAKRVQQAGFDPDLMKKNPGLAVAKMLAAVNPDVEVVDVNERRGVITLREKKTGKTVTVDFEQAKQGRISFEGDDGKRVTIEGSGEGEGGIARITSPEGTMELGTKIENMPGWVPEYPGASTKGVMSMKSDKGNAGTFSFNTGDSVDEIVGFYDKVMQREGFKVSKTVTPEGGMVHGEKSGQSLMVMIGQEGGNRQVAVTFSDR